jgi:phosphate transport system permease protein
MLNKHCKSRIKKLRLNRFWEYIAERTLLLCASAAIVSVLIISVYIFYSGLPIFGKAGFREIVFGTEWKPLEGQFGILPMIIASIITTLGAVALAAFIGLMTAVFLAEIAPAGLAKIVRPAVELLAGIPSVVYGFFGLIVLVPLIDKYLGGGGNSLLAAVIILIMMVLPTIINIAESSLRAVPSEYKEGSLALGASQIQTIFKVQIPAAKSGIIAGIVLGMGRAIGETMAVILVIGNTPQIPTSLLDRARTLTSNIALEMSYAEGLHQEALFATGVVLFIFIMLLNIAVTFLFRKAGEGS